MGDVISISRVSDVDIFAEFDAQCPTIPDDIDSRIPRSARKAVDGRGAQGDQTLFRKHCAIVVVLSLCILAIVKFVSGSIATQLGMQYRDFESSNTSHRQSQAAWAGYISTMEQDAYYQRVVKEKQLYQQRFPGNQVLTGGN